ncbi:hypothetical protein [Paenibacillus silvae]|uniref:Uncharacterized protein n=1 Tax=Paenibacillus silvae TaxID=1325358 RepID=A0A2W6NNE7_9BACL|nr:hypothetical protein [Paenibacillus silvae]PZT57372.1 hypothetical protein DN757_01570 [Paenibacillus silvae]
MKSYDEIEQGQIIYAAKEEEFWDADSESHGSDGILEQYTKFKVKRCDDELVLFEILTGKFCGKEQAIYWWGEGAAQPGDYLTQEEYDAISGKHLNTPTIEEYKEALNWVVDQFEKVLAGEKAGNVVESLSYAKSLL